VSIDRTNKSISFLSLPTECPDAITYDILVLAQGADTQYYGIEGAKEYTLPLKRAEHVTAIHERATSIISKGTPASFMIVGAGAAGVEALFALKSFVNAVCKKIHPDLADKMSYTLVQAGPEILPGFLPRIIHMTRKEIERHGMRVLTNEAVQSVTRTTVSTTQYKNIPTDLVIWTAGIKPNQLPIEPALHTDGPGWIRVDHNLMAAPDIFAGGDISSYREHNMTIPKNAQTGMTMGEHLAKNVLRHITRTHLTPFHYVSKGNILVIGNTGFLDIKGICIKTRFTHQLREILYRMRQHQMAG
jgi:NADH dehydrogenase